MSWYLPHYGNVISASDTFSSNDKTPSSQYIFSGSKDIFSKFDLDRMNCK